MFLAKDFIETAEGLIFAVVENGMEQGKILCFLRYIRFDKQLMKVNTVAANQLLSANYPHYLYFSPIKDAHLHAVSSGDVLLHHQPRTRLNYLLNHLSVDAVEQDLNSLCILFKENQLKLKDTGVTGSLLIGAQKKQSDIDLVFYDRNIFHRARRIAQQLTQQECCNELSEQAWEASYDRRGCALSYEEYVWHEKRKLNKVLINGRKVDLSFISENQDNNLMHYKKLASITVKVQVTDDFLAFDYPAIFRVDHSQIDFIVCYTATYTGQAQVGEWIEVAGRLELSANGDKRIVVGSSREASGEYIKVIHD